MFPGCLTVMLSVLFTCFSATVFAVEEPYVNELKGSQVAADKSFTVSDEKFNSSTSWALIQQNISVDDIVSFELNFDTSIYFYNQPFNCTINFKIYIYGNQADTSEITDSTTHANINLEIRYDTVTGKPYKGIALYKFRNAHKFKVKIISITSPQLSPIPAIFRVKGQIIVNRKYNWNDNSSDVTRFTVLNGNQLKLEWTPSLYPGAEMFDLEYTYIDRNSQMAASIGSYTFGANYNVPADTLAKWFVNNSTRITTAAAAHLINMPYDSGYIIFRIRGVQIHYPDELRWEGNWNYIARPSGSSSCGGSLDPCPSAVVRFDGHEQNLNWQFSISFAEEGKQKIVTSYFSGLLHNRQSVTINNTDNKTVVQETIYDALGRPAASILPAPTNDSTIHYFRGFNKNKNGNPYSFSDLLYGSGCTTTADSVSHVSGTGNYYSTSNVFQGTYSYAKYIPNAGGYPFAVTEYMADNTGRIKAQGGVGDTFQLHTNHATKYFYGKPTQTELDRLFGSEAGNASHYLKNMVQDANGQISVSYQDASGKTVATALAGATPPNVHDLPSNTTGTAVQVSNDLIKPGDFSRNPGDYSLSASATFLAAATGTYVFNYRVDPLVYQKLFGPDKDSVICSDCYYDLEITVKDDCNNLIDSVGLSAGAVFDTACANQPDTIQGTMNVTLNKIGEYYITYTLRLSQDALNFYDSVHLIKNSDIKKINYFLLEELKETDFYGCYSNCETCFDKLGTKPEFVKTFKSFYEGDSLVFGTADSLWAIALYDSLYSNCQAIQVDCHLNVCDIKLAMLKLDVSPGGQYALYDSAYNLLERPINRLDTAWRNQIVFFTNELGIRDSIVIYNEDGDDSVKVDVKDLSDSLFIKNWKDVWADSLVRLHPEYCYYLWCLANSTSYEFDNNVENLMDADTAIAKGWFDPAVYYKILDADPFFAGGANIVRYTKMKKDLQFFSRRYMRNALSAKNILQFIDVVLYCKTQPNGWNACNPDSACRSRNREWFLYKTLYLNLKQKYYEEARRLNPQFANCTNCHIGGDVLDDTGLGGCIAPPVGAFILRNCIENGEPVSDCKEYFYPDYVNLTSTIVLKYSYQNAICPGGCIGYVVMNPGDSVAQVPYGNISTVYTLLDVSCDVCIPPPVSEFVLGGAPSCPPGFDESVAYTGSTPPSHSLILRVERFNNGNLFDTVSIVFPANQTYQCYSLPHIFSYSQIVEVLCDTSYVPFTDSTCNTYCPGGIYDPYDRDSISYYVEYGNPNIAPSGTPPNYGNCQFYPAFELYTGPTTSCRFFNVWVCEYDSACGGICPEDSVCTTGTAFYLKKYGGNKDDFSYHSVSSHDNGTVIAGQTNSFGNGGYDGLLTKVDSEGNVVWSKAVGGTGNDFFDRIIRTTDNGFMVCGQTKSYGNTAGDVWLVKFDASGTVQWSKKYGDGNVNGEMAYDVIQLSDGGYAFCGVHRFAGGVAQSFVVRTDDQGNAVWSKQYGNTLSDDATGLLEDGNSLLVTGFYQGTSFYEGYLMKLDLSDGAVEWVNGYDAENRSTWFNKISKTNSGYQVFSIITDNFSDQNQQECIWNLDTDGNVQDIRKLVIPGNWTISYGWHPLSDGGFIGVNGANNSGSDVIVCHVDASGNVDWSKKYITTGKQQITTIAPSSGGGYVCTGINNNPGTVADSNDVYVMRIDDFGDAGSCSGVNTSDLTVANPSYTTPTSNVVDIGTVSIVNPVITVGVVSFTFSGNTMCSSCLLQPADDFPSSCTGTGSDTLYKHKQRRYPEYVNPKDLLNQISNGNPQQGSSQSEQDIINECKNTCEAQADYWIRTLGRCTANPALLEQLRLALIDICSKGCSMSTTFGTSTIPASIPATYHSFEEAINAIIPGAYNDSCTAELLAMPYPHDRQPVVAERVIIETDYAICQRLGQFRTAYLNSGSAGSMHQFMLNTYGSAYTLDSTELDDMLNACLNCNGILKNDIVLPVLFDPQSRPCLKCDSVTLAFAAFNAKFPSITVTDDDYENLFANFFNHRFGFALTYDDYQTFLDSCTAHPGYPAQLCNGPVSEDVAMNDNSCILELYKTALTNATYTYIAYIDSVRRDFREAWLTKCMNVQPVLKMTASLYEYHYTLYYYDQSGNLVKTVPPEGVDLLSSIEIALVQRNRDLNNTGCYQYSDSIRLSNNAKITYLLNTDFGATPYTIEGYLNLASYGDQVLLSKISETDIFPPFGNYIYNGLLVHINGNKLWVDLYGTTGNMQHQASAYSNKDIGFLIPANKWTNLAIEYTGIPQAPVRIFINGNAVALTVSSSLAINDIVDTPAPLIVGSHDLQSYVLFGQLDGTFKNLRVYNRLLLPGELRQNSFNPCQLPVNESNLVFWSPMNTAPNNDVPEVIQGITGDLSGFTWQSSINTSPEHRLVTTYHYNSLNQVLQQYSPDGDTSVFFYDRLGRLTVSQNKEQKEVASYSGSANRFSYTKYDALGRINQVGEKSGATDIRTVDLLDDVALSNWINNIGHSGVDRQITKTIYDSPINLYQTATTSRKRVVASIYLENASDTEGDSTLYAYDILGNVKKLVQYVKALVAVDPTNGAKEVLYEYDLVSGKVNMVSYQPNKGDQFFYKYLYDADNRVIRSLTSRDKLIWIEDASYNYYLHGPLARTELGQYKVQGVDYAYTLQGWLKGINSNALSPQYEMGQDGWAGTSFERVSRDVYSYGLGYFNLDYKAIGGTGAAAMTQALYQHPSGADNTGRQLYNGNISHTEVAMSKIDNGAVKGYSYGYDQLNRLVFMNQHTISGSTWNNTNIISAYAESIAYDANGNILKYLRKGANISGMPLDMDSLNYKYNRDINGNIVNNRLNHVRDQVNSTNYTVDIDNQSNNNYTYDFIGNLKTDVAEEIGNVDWTVYGKIRKVEKSSTVIQYGYDPGGNRTWKNVFISGGTFDEEINTWYIRDAQGNVLAVYSKKNGEAIKWDEQHLYGNSRLGMWKWDTIVPAGPPMVGSNGTPIYDSLLSGSRTYELSNHLGNVLTTISDKKVGHNNGAGVVDYYLAEVLTANDYYPFGMMMPGRSFSAVSGYRYG
ncbi:MAG: DUF6443 domain-containing protein, partial [Chitinophagaceae bacterium]